MRKRNKIILTTLTATLFLSSISVSVIFWYFCEIRSIYKSTPLIYEETLLNHKTGSLRYNMDETEAKHLVGKDYWGNNHFIFVEEGPEIKCFYIGSCGSDGQIDSIEKIKDEDPWFYSNDDIVVLSCAYPEMDPRLKQIQFSRGIYLYDMCYCLEETILHPLGIHCNY